jgi:hypothetical protein
MWARRSVWLHWLLTAYLWLIAWLPLGDWNRQADDLLLPQMLAGKGIERADVLMLVFVTIPALLFWLGYIYRSVWLAASALIFDAVWSVMQILSWWIPYLFGTAKPWQVAYAKGPTTKVLPSFGKHIAPDGMHFAIHVLLAAALVTGVIGLRNLRKTPVDSEAT